MKAALHTSAGLRLLRPRPEATATLGKASKGSAEVPQDYQGSARGRIRSLAIEVMVIAPPS